MTSEKCFWTVSVDHVCPLYRTKGMFIFLVTTFSFITGGPQPWKSSFIVPFKWLNRIFLFLLEWRFLSSSLVTVSAWFFGLFVCFCYCCCFGFCGFFCFLPINTLCNHHSCFARYEIYSRVFKVMRGHWIAILDQRDVAFRSSNSWTILLSLLPRISICRFQTNFKEEGQVT